jgi:hypothetical protein
VHPRALLDEIMAAFRRITFARPNRLRQRVDFDRATGSDLLRDPMPRDFFREAKVASG